MTFDEYWNTQPRYMDFNTNEHIKSVAKKAWDAAKIDILKDYIKTANDPINLDDPT